MDKIKMRFLMGLVLVGHVFTLAFSLGKPTSSMNMPQIEYERTNHTITFSLHFPSIQWQQTDAGSSILIPNAEIYTNPGDPDIPYFSTTVALPPGTSLKPLSIFRQHIVFLHRMILNIHPPLNLK
jgi:hypothetical protein